MTHTVTILPERETLSAPDGVSLLTFLRNIDRAPDAPCGGNGKCGKCRVQINGTRQLACRTVIDRDLTLSFGGEKEQTAVLTSGKETAISMNPARSGYLLAVDIGTTTVAAYLLNPADGSEMAHAGMLNPQQPYGADVISRIQAALKGELEALTRIIRQGITELIHSLCRKSGIIPDEIGVVSIVGNPAMQQLFLGISPQNLAAVPFPPVLTRAEVRPAAEYLPVCRHADLLVVPDIAGYVGADTLGCVLATKMYESEQIILMVDIGTNGEMVLGNRDRMAACATAAGPALEGANIRFGMRGAPGAIDHVILRDEKLSCHVIGETAAKGICGSGLIDAAAALLNGKQINRRGRIQDTGELDGQRYVPLANDIYLTQDDIRQLQMAKGAVAAGIELMAAHLGITPEQIDQVLLAGAFGSFLNPDSACRIGLLPPSLRPRITVVGNAAGIGAKRIACSKQELSLAQDLAGKIEFIELADIPGFQRAFARNMNFNE